MKEYKETKTPIEDNMFRYVISNDIHEVVFYCNDSNYEILKDKAVEHLKTKLIN